MHSVRFRLAPAVAGLLLCVSAQASAQLPAIQSATYVGGLAAPVGMVHWIFHRSNWTIGDYCYLQDLFVAPGVRGGGVGRALIESVYEAARRAGSPRVYWLTHESNAEAITLYDRVADRSGFVQYRKVL